MTSATLIYFPHLNEIPPQRNGLTGAPYTTENTVGSRPKLEPDLTLSYDEKWDLPFPWPWEIWVRDYNRRS